MSTTHTSTETVLVPEPELQALALLPNAAAQRLTP